MSVKKVNILAKDVKTEIKAPPKNLPETGLFLGAGS